MAGGLVIGEITEQPRGERLRFCARRHDRVIHRSEDGASVVEKDVPRSKQGHAARRAFEESWWDFVSLMPAALVFGHFFGMPVLVIVGAVDKLMSPVLTPRRRRIPA